MMIDISVIWRYVVGFIGLVFFSTLGGAFWGNAISQYKNGKYNVAGCSIVLGLIFVVLMIRVLWVI